jgi:predicted dehydrogenase
MDCADTDFSWHPALSPDRRHADRRNTGSLLLQKGAHDIDIIHFLAGATTTRVHAMGRLAVYGRCKRRDEKIDLEKASHAVENATLANWPPTSQTGLNHIVDVEDLSMMTMELSNGVLAQYSQVHFTPTYWRNYTVIGDRGMIENFGDTSEDAVVKLWNTRSSGYRSDADEVHDVGGDSADHGGSDVRIVEDFLQYARGMGPAKGASPAAARASVAAAVAATESLRNNGVPYDIPRLDAATLSFWLGK